MNQIGIIGAGAWGTALAQALAADGQRNVTLWARNPDVLKSIAARRENSIYLPGVALHKNIEATDSLAQATQADTILLAAPAQHTRSVLADMPAAAGKSLVVCAKGIEIASGKMMADVVAEQAPGATVAVLTGPTFATEIGHGLPSAATLACADAQRGEAIRDMLACRTLRLYLSDDMTGAQVGGAVKNVIAIACGIIVGHGFGESARAALMTRGLAEMARLCNALGGQRETLMGMCGVGDLMLTCSSLQSRNYSLGVELGQGRRLSDIMARRKSVTEGVHTAEALIKMAARTNTEMPIAAIVTQVLEGVLGIEDAITAMLGRPPRREGI